MQSMPTGARGRECGSCSYRDRSLRLTRKGNNAANRRNRAVAGLVCARARRDTAPMLTQAKTALLLATLLFPMTRVIEDAESPSTGPEYTSDAQLRLPEHYRDWVYL